MTEKTSKEATANFSAQPHEEKKGNAEELKGAKEYQPNVNLAIFTQK